MASTKEPRWQKRLKNGYIQRDENSAGYLVYVARPLYSMDDYATCTFSNYHPYSWRQGPNDPYAARPVDRRRVNIPDTFNRYGASRAAEASEGERRPKHRVPVTSRKQGSRSHIALRDDPIEDGCALAGDVTVLLPSGGPLSTRSGPASEATVEDKEISDLVQRGLLRGACSSEMQLNDLVRPTAAYTIRYTTRKRSKGWRKAEAASSEADLVIVDMGEIWEQDWEMV
jgi:hypothetical protein